MTVPAILFGRSNRLSIQLFRYTLVGGVAFGVDFGTLYFLTDFFGIHYLVSAAFAFLAGLVTNYALSIRWVFSRRTVSNRWLELGIFSLVGGMGLGLNEVFLWLFTEKLNFYYLTSKLFSTGFVYLWNFAARKILLFR